MTKQMGSQENRRERVVSMAGVHRTKIYQKMRLEILRALEVDLLVELCARVLSIQWTLRFLRNEVDKMSSAMPPRLRFGVVEAMQPDRITFVAVCAGRALSALRTAHA